MQYRLFGEYLLMCLSVDVEGWRHYFSRVRTEGTLLNCSDNRFREVSFLQPLRHILEIFDNHQVTSTFFVQGEIAKSSPDVIEQIYDMGHEIASHCYTHKNLRQINEDDFEKHEKMNRELLAKITGDKPKGFRAPMFSINTWIINSLEKIGYVYDSSVVPSVKIPGWFEFCNAPLYPYHPSKQNISKECEFRDFCEVPMAVFPFLRLPAPGGWFLRNMGLAYTKTAIRLLLRKNYPAILYIHLQDLSMVKPDIDRAPFHMFRNCGRYALAAVENILRNVNARKTPISEIVSAWV